MDTNVLLKSVRCPKKIKPKKMIKKLKDPIKIVYISNPLKVKTSASEFMALVQELTGQDAEFPNPVRVSGTENDLVDCPIVHHDDQNKICGDEYLVEDVVQPGNDCSSNWYERFNDDDYFMPQMFDNFCGLFPLK